METFYCYELFVQIFHAVCLLYDEVIDCQTPGSSVNN